MGLSRKLTITNFQKGTYITSPPPLVHHPSTSPPPLVHDHVTSPPPLVHHRITSPPPLVHHPITYHFVGEIIWKNKAALGELDISSVSNFFNWDSVIHVLMGDIITDCQEKKKKKDIISDYDENKFEGDDYSGLKVILMKAITKSFVVEEYRMLEGTRSTRVGNTPIHKQTKSQTASVEPERPKKVVPSQEDRQPPRPGTQLLHFYNIPLFIIFCCLFHSVEFGTRRWRKRRTYNGSR